MNLEKHYLSILESLHDAVFVVSKDSTIVYVNQAYSRHFGIPSNKIIGRRLTEMEPKARILEVLLSGKELVNDYSYVHSLRKDVCANLTPLMEDGELIGAVGIMKDISEVMALQEELKQYRSYSSKLERQLYQQEFSLLDSKNFKMLSVVNLARKVAATEASVIIYGETGVGKELMAKAIHEASSRMDKPFVPINMASIPESLFESELFGHEEGSFTGSRKGGKKGIFELANGGTLFLDEIGEMPLNLQAKILRVIQERTFQRVGGTKSYPLEVRIITATHRDLSEQIKQGNFREDLYYRLNVVSLHIPPLRERKEDLPFLISTLLSNLNSKYKKYGVVTPEVVDILTQHQWPGNVRELVNALERMVAVSDQTYFVTEDIPEYIRLKENSSEKAIPIQLVNSGNQDQNLDGLMEKTERNLIADALRKSKNRTEAIYKLGISRKTFYEKLRKHGLL
ncbi:PAS modulated Fis family sigma-54-specific transcriptional regulator [Neobacillus bataviensis LMG 21833]|uniref:PAS modulated Fis family sigma-54-specific transcriptional regulator n=1 Tax=Neobacillus bataviensis LMG 21833 TaxID=1117379 RepID=K6DZ37_9BACI|nr:sigma-54-dependent Fis family transcriptional regulator [Neobacillus bataviensis]EKN66146.1 PAS modulated Fis family sigma-54-specific transcriptional regulator [Neobacillus bataviensis LMG 21833]